MDSPSLNTLQGKLPAFREWLSACGASLLVPTNEWEVLRFVGDNGTSVIYRNARGAVTFTGQSGDAWTAFRNKHPLRFAAKSGRQHLTPKQRAVRERDGNLCFLCGMPVVDDVSLDHLVPLTHGGPNHVGNLVLTHIKCNADAGHKSAADKIAAHVAWRLAQAARPQH